MAYSLFMFMRDIAAGDLAGWINQQLATVVSPAQACRKSNPDILVVQPAENWAAKNARSARRARDRRILLQG
jgi:hypothetical protein